MAKLLPLLLFAVLAAGCTDEPIEMETMTFGSYEQDNDLKNGSEPIEWIVLAKDAEKTLLLSKDVIEFMPYNDMYAGKDDSISLIFWHDCTLRAWLNGEFLETAFTEEERGRIALCDHANVIENDFFFDAGTDTQDSVFLLSRDEAQQYLPDSRTRKAVPSAYALAKGVRVDNYGCCRWWLRSFSEEDHAYYIDKAGGMSKRGFYIYYYADSEIRPALWLYNE